MAKNNEPKIALFIDFDNLAIGLKEYSDQQFDAGLIINRLLDKGRIIYKRAYADWYLFTDDKRKLHDHGIEMIDIPMRRNIGKNSADIRMVVDALDLCYTKDHIDTFVVGSGDSDFTPLVSKLKENNKKVIGFGLRHATSNILANNCDEFIFYEDLITLPKTRPQLPPGLTKQQHDAFTLVLDAVAALMRESKDVLWGSLVKDAIRRKLPSFYESQYGYHAFTSLLEDVASHGLIGLIRDPKSGGTPVVTGYGMNRPAQSLNKPAAPTHTTGDSLIPKSPPTSTIPIKKDDSKLIKKTRVTAKSTVVKSTVAKKSAATKKVVEKKTITPPKPIETVEIKEIKTPKVMELVEPKPVKEKTEVLVKKSEVEIKVEPQPEVKIAKKTVVKKTAATKKPTLTKAAKKKIVEEIKVATDDKAIIEEKPIVEEKPVVVKKPVKKTVTRRKTTTTKKTLVGMTKSVSTKYATPVKEKIEVKADNSKVVEEVPATLDKAYIEKKSVEEKIKAFENIEEDSKPDSITKSVEKEISIPDTTIVKNDDDKTAPKGQPLKTRTHRRRR
jgi:uncharacterized protein (TIGR00288 family)